MDVPRIIREHMDENCINLYHGLPKVRILKKISELLKEKIHQIQSQQLEIKEEMQFPYEIKKLNKHFEIYKNDEYLVQVGPQKCLLPSKYEQLASVYYNFQVRSDDVFIVTFPRSGTTLTQELVWLILNNLDIKIAKEKVLSERSPYFDSQMVMHGRDNHSESYKKVHDIFKNSINILNEMQGRRTIKTHLPLCLLPPDILTCGAKIIYVARNPRDVIVSFYHLINSFRPGRVRETFEVFYDMFENGLIKYTPYWSHIEQGWEKRNVKNVCFLFYEEYIKDLRSTIRKVADFLEKPLSAAEIDILEEHLCFKNFKNNSSVNETGNFKKAGLFSLTDQNASFIREGKIGGWKQYFDGKLYERSDKWIKDNVEKIGIEFLE